MEYLFKIFLMPLWSVVFARAKAVRESALLSTLAVGIENQFPLTPLIDAIADESRGLWRRRLMALSHLLESGSSVAEALGTVSGIMAPDAVAMIRVGADSGQLSMALREASRVARRRSEIALPLVQAKVFYLLFVWIWLLGVGSFLLYYVVPKHKAIFEGFGIKLPEVTRVIIGEGPVGAEFWYFIGFGVPFVLVLNWMLLGFAAGLTGIEPAWRFSPLGFYYYWKPRAKTPHLLRSMAIVVEGRRPLSQTFDSLLGSHRERGLHYQLAQLAAMLERGSDCWFALRAGGLLRSSEVPLLEAAEKAGNLAWALRLLADRIERHRLFRFQAAVQFIEPVVISMIGCLVGLFCVGMFYPIVELIQVLSS